MFINLNRIRTNIRVSKKQIIYSVIFSFIFGFSSGLIAKILDSTLIPNKLSFLGSIGSQWGVWIFILTFIAAYSYTPNLATIRVFVFLTAMLFSYYIYTFLILNLFPLKYIVFWSLVALLSTIPAYIMWFSRSDHLISSIITSLPVSAIAFEGYKNYLFTVEYYDKYANVESVVVSDGPRIDMIGIGISYTLMIISILLFIPQRKIQILYIILFSLVIFSALVAIIL